MTNKLTITNENGQSVEAEKIIAFEIPDFGRKYIIYTFNEVDTNGLAKLYVCQIESEENGTMKLKGIETDDEWTRIKSVMREIITGGNA